MYDFNPKNMGLALPSCRKFVSLHPINQLAMQAII